ncbi:hypothetical protein [Pedobacter namyangjuensis]|uniref:hypothetical protein n=1 Tax=Pedobacter namyangjuensis TaxID=600626 RepID=UPI000DE579A0|nr:hypothetical protein [Pedobacter namyangjuensis]
MKKNLFNALIALLITCSLSSCATVFGGKVTTAQRTPPAAGEPTRPIRAVALIADIILFWPGLIVDFATGAIYKPEGNGVTKPVITEKIATPPAK